MVITKNVLKQYNDIKTEIKDIQKDISKTEDSIENLIKEGTVQDKVKGGLGGIQGFKIEGFPQKEYDKRLKILRGKLDRLAEKENTLLELTESMEKFIDTIPISRDRQILKASFIEKQTQQEIADKLYIDRSIVSKIISKHL